MFKVAWLHEHASPLSGVKGHDFCAEENTCAENSACVNLDAGASCSCKNGFRPLREDSAYCEGEPSIIRSADNTCHVCMRRCRGNPSWLQRWDPPAGLNIPAYTLLVQDMCIMTPLVIIGYNKNIYVFKIQIKNKNKCSLCCSVGMFGAKFLCIFYTFFKYIKKIILFGWIFLCFIRCTTCYNISSTFRKPKISLKLLVEKQFGVVLCSFDCINNSFARI